MTLDEIENLEGLNAKDIMKKLRDREAMAFNPELLGFKKLNNQRHEGITSYSKGDIVKYYIHHCEKEKTWLFQRTLMMHTTLEVNLKVPNHAWGVEFLTNAGVI